MNRRRQNQTDGQQAPVLSQEPELPSVRLGQSLLPGFFRRGFGKRGLYGHKANLSDHIRLSIRQSKKPLIPFYRCPINLGRTEIPDGSSRC